MYLKGTSPWMFSSYKTSKTKNKDFAKQNKFFAMPMPMPTSMPMLVPRCQCRDFQMALKSSFRSEDFCLDLLVMHKTGLIRKIRLISRFMTSQPRNRQIQYIYCPVSQEEKTIRQDDACSFIKKETLAHVFSC